MKTVKAFAHDGTIKTDLDITQHGLHDLLFRKDSSYERIMAKRGTPSAILGVKNNAKAVEIAKFIICTYLRLILLDIINEGYTFCFFAGRFNVTENRHDLTQTDNLKWRRIVGMKKLMLNSTYIFHFLPNDKTKRFLKGFYYYSILLGEYAEIFKKNKKNGNRY